MTCIRTTAAPARPLAAPAAGMPAALLLQRGDATVTIIHSKTPNAQQICQEADIIIAACGQAEMVQGDWVKPGAAVIDVGINAVDVSVVPAGGWACRGGRLWALLGLAAWIPPVLWRHRHFCPESWARTAGQGRGMSYQLPGSAWAAQKASPAPCTREPPAGCLPCGLRSLYVAAV